MKKIIVGIILLCCVMGLSTLVFAKAKTGLSTSKTEAGGKETIPKSIKGAKAVPGPFRVKNVTFKEVVLNNKRHLVAAVVFNRNVDATTVQQNGNIRLIRKNENHFWVDASTQNNTVRIRPNFITWVCGAELETGYYKMLLRGTIKSHDGVYLDCDGDGKGEGGSLPAFESQLYHAVVRDLELIDPEVIENLRDRLKQ